MSDVAPELQSFVGGDLDATERESPESAMTARVRSVARPVGETYPIPGLGDRIAEALARTVDAEEKKSIEAELGRLK